MTPIVEPCQQPPAVHADAWAAARDVSVGAAGNGVRKLEAQARLQAAGITLDRNTAIKELVSIGTDYGEPGWDGYGANAISRRTVARAIAFLLTIPSSVPGPDIVPEPTGTIAFEWQTAGSSVFSVSVMEGYLLAYAGLYGVGRSYGTEVFVDEFPRSFLDQLRRLYADAEQREVR